MGSYQGNAPIANNLYGVANATTSSNPLISVFMTRDPTSADINYQVKQRWINTSEHSEWILTGFSQSNNTTVANWIQLSDGDSLTQIGVPSGTSPVTPDANGLINFTTSGSLAITGSAGGLGAQNINFDISNYASGTWTPNLQVGGVSATQTSSGQYLVLKSVLYFSASIQVSSWSGTGNVTISNLPLAASSAAQGTSVAVANFSGISSGQFDSLSFVFNASSSVGIFVIATLTGGASSFLTNADLSASFFIFFNGFYFIQ